MIADAAAGYAACRDALALENIDVFSYHTLENAADIAAIPAALGIEKIDIFAGSYATRLAARLMERHPDSVRVAVLGGVSVLGGVELEVGTRYESYSMESEAKNVDGFVNKVPNGRVSIVLSTGEMNELDDQRYALCESSDGGLYYVTSEKANLPTTLRRGSVVRFEEKGGKKSNVSVLDDRSPEEQITKKGLTWLDSLDQESVNFAKGAFKNVVKKAWEERQMFLFEHGIAPIRSPLVQKNELGAQKPVPIEPKREPVSVKSAATKSENESLSVQEKVSERRNSIEVLGRDALKEAIEKRTNKTHVDSIGKFKGVISSHYNGYSVVESKDKFMLVPTNERIKKATYRRIDITIKVDESRYFIHPPYVRPATFADAKRDIEYKGPTWLDQQFSNPSQSSLIAPDVLENLDALKRERLQFLVSIKYLRENEKPSSSFMKDLRRIEKRVLISEIRDRTKLSYLPDANHFSGKMHKQEVKKRGGTYVVVSNKTDFVVLSADKNLRKHRGETVKISKTKDKNGRTRLNAVRHNPKEMER